MHSKTNTVAITPKLIRGVTHFGTVLEFENGWRVAQVKINIWYSMTNACPLIVCRQYHLSAEGPFVCLFVCGLVQQWTAPRVEPDIDYLLFSSFFGI